MNSIEFFFAVTAVGSATAVIYARNRIVYGLDDRYNTHNTRPQQPDVATESAEESAVQI